jgi:hypothetical protein
MVKALQPSLCNMTNVMKITAAHYNVAELKELGVGLKCECSPRLGELRKPKWGVYNKTRKR